MSEKTYVVSGAASGIGAATAAQLAGEGHRVISVDQRDADVVADLATADGRAAAVTQVQGMTDVVHGLVPCAGIGGFTGIDSALVTSVNFFGAIALVKGLRPQLTAAGGAGVVVLSSNSSTCQPGWELAVAEACLAEDEEAARAAASKVESVVVYPATKTALAWWARREGVKPEWAGAGIRLNAVAPGLIATPMTDALRADPQLGAFADSYPTALNRPGKPEEIASAICWLLSDAASLCVGSVLFVDGGTDAMLHPSSPERWVV